MRCLLPQCSFLEREGQTSHANPKIPEESIKKKLVASGLCRRERARVCGKQVLSDVTFSQHLTFFLKFLLIAKYNGFPYDILMLIYYGL
jgi:hypothetical protein